MGSPGLGEVAELVWGADLFLPPLPLHAALRASAPGSSAQLLGAPGAFRAARAGQSGSSFSGVCALGGLGSGPGAVGGGAAAPPALPTAAK